MSRQPRSAISVSGKFHAELERKAEKMGVPVSWIVEASIAHATGIAPSDPAIAAWAKSFRLIKAA